MDALNDNFNTTLSEENTNEISNENLFIEDLDFIDNSNFDASKLTLDEINELIKAFES